MNDPVESFKDRLKLPLYRDLGFHGPGAYGYGAGVGSRMGLERRKRSWSRELVNKLCYDISKSGPLVASAARLLCTG